MNIKANLIDVLINSGSSITGNLIGGFVGTAVGGTIGGLVGSISRTAVESLFFNLGEEVKNKKLSRRENIRVGATNTYTS